MVINLEEKNSVELYLSIMSLGILRCLEEDLIDFDDSAALLYQPMNIQNLEKHFKELGNAIHLGTELEDVSDLIPEKLPKSMKEIEALNLKLIEKTISEFRKNRNKQAPKYTI